MGSRLPHAQAWHIGRREMSSLSRDQVNGLPPSGRMPAPFRPYFGQRLLGETKWEKGVETAPCDSLRFPAVSCGFLRLQTTYLADQRPNLQKSAKIFDKLPFLLFTLSHLALPEYFRCKGSFLRVLSARRLQARRHVRAKQVVTKTLPTVLLALSDPALRPPPHRDIGYSYAYHIYDSQIPQGMVLQNCSVQGRWCTWGGYRKSMLSSVRYSTIGDIAAVLSQIACFTRGFLSP